MFSLVGIPVCPKSVPCYCWVSISEIDDQTTSVSFNSISLCQIMQEKRHAEVAITNTLHKMRCSPLKNTTIYFTLIGTIMTLHGHNAIKSSFRWFYIHTVNVQCHFIVNLKNIFFPYWHKTYLGVDSFSSSGKLWQFSQFTKHAPPCGWDYQFCKCQHALPLKSPLVYTKR